MFDTVRTVRNARLWVQLARSGAVRTRGYATVPEVGALLVVTLALYVVVMLNLSGSACFWGSFSSCAFFSIGFSLLKIGVLSHDWWVQVYELERIDPGHQELGLLK